MTCPPKTRPEAALPTLLFAAALMACGALPSEVEVGLDYPLGVSGALSGVQGERLPGVGSQVRQEVSNEGVPIERIEAVHVTDLDLVHLSPICEFQVGCDLAFIATLDVFVEGTDLARVRIGRLESPGAVRLAPVDLDDVDLSPYVKADEMAFVAEVHLEQRPIQDVALELRATLRVDVDLF
jgi:hypothetical protein